MNEFYQLWMIYILAFLVLAILPLVIVNFFTHGFLFKWLACRISRGKKLLVVLSGVRRDSYFTGTEADGMLKFKDSTKEERKMALPQKSVRHGWALDYVLVDDETNNVVSLDFSTLNGHDAKKVNSLMLRCLYKPALLDNQERLKLLLSIGILVVCLWIAYQQYVNGNRLVEIKTLIEGLKTAGQAAGSAAQTLATGG